MTGLLDMPDPSPGRVSLDPRATSMPGPTDPAEVLAEQLALDLAAAWRAGRCPSVKEILDGHPEVNDHPRAAVRLIYEEICLRQELGVEVSTAELLSQFPRYHDELCVLLEGHRLLGPIAGEPVFPEIGEVFEGAMLLAELGRGGSGRVFLATQTDLADRPVVLKVTSRLGGEHLALARLQHTHIVPLYGAGDRPDVGLRVLCMPYLGHATLARVFGALSGQPPRARSGADIVAVVEQAQAELSVPLLPRGPGINRFARASYEQAICWIGCCLARALHYAHERGLVHLDVKPSNVLLAADGTPMLLDFHLAQGPIRPDEPVTERIGGTPTYMSPEQAGALDTARAGRKITGCVDERSDIYSLGLLLYEAFNGTVREASEESARRLCRNNPNVSPGLASLIARCLARDSRHRYPDAKSLAEDLRRHLADLPLRGVANRNLRERWRKWRRRRPHAPALLVMGLTVALAVVLAVAASVGQWSQRLHDAEAALAQIPKDGRPDPQAAPALEHALVLARSTPFGNDLARRLAAGLCVARRIEAAGRLSRIADRLRFDSSADFRNPAQPQLIDGLCREIWAARGMLLDAADAPLPAELERQIRADLLDLVILSADLGVRSGPAEDRNTAGREGLRRLDEAEAVLGWCAALERERQAIAETLGLKDLAREAALRASSSPPRTALDFYELGLSLLRRGEIERATDTLERAASMHPQAFWPNFHRGLCAARLSRYLDAVEAFGFCIALAPESAPCYAHRAQAWEALGRLDRAERDFDRTLELDPQLPGAWANRGLLKLRSGRPREAIFDLRRALESGSDPAPAHYNLALAHLALGDQARALESAQAALQINPAYASALDLIDRLKCKN